MMWRVLIAAAVCTAAAPAMAADPVAGERAFAACKGCHQVGEGARNAAGPTLNGVVGRQAAVIEGFRYSEAMRNSGLVWDKATLSAYTRDPKATIPGSEKAFAGVKDAARIADIIAYLAQFNTDGSRKP